MRILLERQNPQLLWALALAFVYHGGLLLSGSYAGTYDAYVHIFFADHYARSWFDHWEPRWYTGFPMTSYPPGSQQSVALWSFLVGLPTAFVMVALFSVLNCTLGVYRFSRIWVSERAAGYAALLFVFASSIAETVHVFGQLPTMFSLGFLLNTVPFVHRFVQQGGVKWLIVAWMMNAATTAGHHVTTLFGAVFFIAPAFTLALVEAIRTPLEGEPPQHPSRITRANLGALVARRLRRVLRSVVRTAIYGGGLVIVLVVTVLPYWLWSKSDPITQVSIPHASRDSFIDNTSAGLVFWLIPYGLSLITIPYVFYKGFSTKAWPLALSYSLLFFLGTGGTTPGPRMLLGGAYEILTLDRFTFWATICQLPLLGEFVVSLHDGRLSRYVKEQFGPLTFRLCQVFLLASYLLTSAFVANFTKFRKFQPDRIDCQPIVAFLDKDQHFRYRFLTLGFGDQMAWLSAQTTASSVDGNYHSARRLPELTTTPVERLEGAKYSGVPGIGSLQQFLAVPEKYNLKFVFSNDEFYDPLLFFSGWHRLQRLENGIMVWERGDIPPMPEALPRKEIPYYQRVMWGAVPCFALLCGSAAMTASIWWPYVLWLFDIDAPGGIATRHKIRRRFWALLARPFRRLYEAFRRLRDRLRASVHGKGVLLALERWLLERSALPDTEDSPPARWQVWMDWVRVLRWPKPATPAAHDVRLVLLLLFAGSAAFLSHHYYQRWRQSPAKVVESYYDALDFRRYRDAYEYLDPSTRPSLESYLLDLSVNGGIIASYGKLDSVVAEVQFGTEDELTMSASTQWVTSLANYANFEFLTLRRQSGRWYIQPNVSDISIPPDQFFRRAEVGWHSSGRRRVTTETTALADVLDRPQLVIVSARLVRYRDRYSAVGEVVNVDADPADLTVTCVMTDGAGRILAQYNAQQVVLHKLLPRERTPFRVDFEGVAGAALDSWDPNRFQPNDHTLLTLHGSLERFEVYAKALVAGDDLRRDVGAQNVRVVTRRNGSQAVVGTLVNTGTIEATIPHVFVTYYDANERIVWVDHAFVRDAIRPQRTQPFEVPVTRSSEVEVVLERGHAYANNLRTSAVDVETFDRFPMPAESGYASARLSIHYFARSR